MCVRRAVKLDVVQVNQLARISQTLQGTDLHSHHRTTPCPVCALPPDLIPFCRLYLTPRLVLRDTAAAFCKTKCRSTFLSHSAHCALPSLPSHLPGCFSVQPLHSFIPRSDIPSIRSINSRTYSSSTSNRRSYSGSVSSHNPATSTHG